MRNRNAIVNDLYGISSIDGGAAFVLHHGGADLMLTPEETIRLGQALIAVGKGRIVDIKRLIDGLEPNQ